MRDPKLRYAVVRHRSDWRVVDANGPHEDFPDPTQAAAHVGELARAAIAMGYDVEVLVQSPVGELRYMHVDRTLH